MDSGNIKKNNLDHVTGLIERVTFHSPESGFAVLRVKVRGHRCRCTAKCHCRRVVGRQRKLGHRPRTRPATQSPHYSHQPTRYGWTFRVGDKVMQVVNNYDKDVFNGDIGRVVGIDRDEQQLTLRFDGLEVEYGFDELDELILSYASTIHKSQGSECPCVVVPIHTQHYMLLQRNLLYTAVTRGRKLVVLVGTKKAIAMAVKRVNSRRRITTLRERLTESFDVRRQRDGMDHAREAKENQGRVSHSGK